MTVPTPRSDALDVLGLLRTAADEVASVLAAQTDWGISGGRTGQYAFDLTADAACIGPLVEAGFGVLSEESGRTGAADDAAAVVVVVDPLDGSTNASRGIGWYATALCAVDAEGPWVALVRNHATGVEHSAIRGQGARRDGEPVRVSGCAELLEAVIGVSGLPSHHYGWAQFRALGAAAPDLCAVADGTLDGWCDMIDDAHGVWDYLAGALICTEAGGAVGERDGRELCVLAHEARRTPIVAATPALLASLLEQRRR